MRILFHGGSDASRPSMDKPFAEALIQHAKKYNQNKILPCFFASEKGEDYIETFKNIFAKIDNKVEIIVGDKAEFEAQMKANEVIFFQGGKTKLLIEAMTKYDLEILKQKQVLAGSSAGANFLSKRGITNGEAIIHGAGIVPKTVLVHANNWNQKTCLELLRTETNEEILLINEETYVEFDI